MPYSNPAIQNAYQNARLQERRREWIEGQGGECVQCGSTESLEVDHVDPSTKVCNPRGIWSRNIGFREMELAKCQVLCADCHKEKTRAEQTTAFCGTRRSYQRGCRCLECKAANARKERLRRARVAG